MPNSTPVYTKARKNQLSDVDAAKVGLWLDDPYGDGIRLGKIRNPDKHRIAAMHYVETGEADIFSDHQVYVSVGHDYANTKVGQTQIRRQQVLG